MRRRDQTMTQAATTVEAFVREGRGILYTARLSLRTSKVRFWRGAKAIGSLRWHAKRERCVGYLDLAGGMDEEPELNSMLIEELENEIRKVLMARLWALSSTPLDEVIDYDKRRRAGLIRGADAEFPSRLERRERSFPEVAKSSGQGSGLRLVEVDAAE